ncbi:NFACT RNA binding domain-containing protein [Nibribacter koreensis]|uniref:NFACT RNA-binding domain-containing protein n=1 Tax=Nibribacter koreensis TaxID=1084519 RepID=A0ABP8FCT4_9BACT
MHQNSFFLKQLAQQLHLLLQGYTCASAFSQEKDELMLEFEKDGQTVFLKVIQTPTFSSLQVPTSFHRARQNSVDLFGSLVGKQVLEVIPHRQERSFYIKFTQEKVLLFKLFGNRSNVVLFEDDNATALFHRKLAKDLALDYKAMDQHFHFDRDQLLQDPASLKKMMPTLGDLPFLYLQEKDWESLPIQERLHLVENMLGLLENPTAYYLTAVHRTLRLSLLPVGAIQETFNDPLQALNAFVPQFRAQEYFQRNYSSTHKALQRQLEVANKIWYQIQEQLEQWHHGTPYAQTADVIMANLSNIPAGSTELELFDFYQNQPRLIKLSRTETPQKTAERLYKKAKNQQIEWRLLQERAQRKEEEVERLTQQLQELEQITTAPLLRQYLKKNTITQTVTAPDLPYHAFELDGFKIWVGKNARANDTLTLKHTHKDDLWLHAKDVPGSHVVIKQVSGKAIPMRVIETAAQLAAYYSKRKSDTLCPVLYTPKKYVRKPKGATAGSVLVEREKVLLVKPENPFRIIP